jgi:hypothetical protein
MENQFALTWSAISFAHMSIWWPFLGPHLTTYHSTRCGHNIAMLNISTSTLLDFGSRQPQRGGYNSHLRDYDISNLLKRPTHYLKCRRVFIVHKHDVYRLYQGALVIQRALRLISYTCHLPTGCNMAPCLWYLHRGVTIGILETTWDKKIGSIKFFKGKIYKFVRSTIALEICPNMIICKIGWRIIPPL